MKKNKVLQIRLTEQEEQYIEMKMKEFNYKNKSEYILNSAITPIKHDKKRLLDLIYEVNKIGVNLNQLTRIAHQNHLKNSLNKEEIISLLAKIEDLEKQLDEILNSQGA